MLQIIILLSLRCFVTRSLKCAQLANKILWTRLKSYLSLYTSCCTPITYTHYIYTEPVLFHWPYCKREDFNEQKKIYYRCEAPTSVQYVEADDKIQTEGNYTQGIIYIDTSQNTTCEHKYEDVPIDKKCTILNIMVESKLEKVLYVKSITPNHVIQKTQLNLTLQSETGGS